MTLQQTDNLRKVVELMATSDVEALPVISERKVVGILSYKDVINAYKFHHEENDRVKAHISLQRKRLKVIVRSRKMFKPKP